MESQRGGRRISPDNFFEADVLLISVNLTMKIVTVKIRMLSRPRKKGFVENV